MKFSELKVGDYFYIYSPTGPIPFKKVELVRTLLNIDDDIFTWNAVSLSVRKAFNYKLFNSEEEIYPFDIDGFY